MQPKQEGLQCSSGTGWVQQTKETLKSSFCPFGLSLGHPCSYLMWTRTLNSAMKPSWKDLSPLPDTVPRLASSRMGRKGRGGQSECRPHPSSTCPTHLHQGQGPTWPPGRRGLGLGLGTEGRCLCLDSARASRHCLNLRGQCPASAI